jgi:hypothetical protein
VTDLDIDPRKAKVVEPTFWGLSVEETAEVLKISPQSVMRDWKMARAWFLAEFTRSRRNIHFSSLTLKLFPLSLQPLTAKTLLNLPVREIFLGTHGPCCA